MTTKALCDKHNDERNRWFDHRKPLQLGIRIAVGTPFHSVPSYVRTRETLVTQIRAIENDCKENRNCS